jgi:hypothetical protein
MYSSINATVPYCVDVDKKLSPKQYKCHMRIQELQLHAQLDCPSQQTRPSWHQFRISSSRTLSRKHRHPSQPPTRTPVAGDMVNLVNQTAVGAAVPIEWASVTEPGVSFAAAIEEPVIHQDGARGCRDEVARGGVRSTMGSGRHRVGARSSGSSEGETIDWALIVGVTDKYHRGNEGTREQHGQGFTRC